jgi:hypothetical protein
MVRHVAAPVAQSNPRRGQRALPVAARGRQPPVGWIDVGPGHRAGPLDVERGDFDGAISYDLRRHTAGVVDNEAKVLALVSDHPYQLTREELAKGIGGNLQKARAVVSALESRGAIGQHRSSRERSDGKKHDVWTFHLIEPASDSGRDETEADHPCA